MSWGKGIGNAKRNYIFSFSYFKLKFEHFYFFVIPFSPLLDAIDELWKPILIKSTKEGIRD